MSYRILHLDLSRPLCPIELSETETGVAIVIRRCERPVGFIMRPMHGKKLVSCEIVRQWLNEEIDPELLKGEWTSTHFPDSALRLFPDLTISICTRNHPEQLQRCLDSLKQARMKCEHAGTGFEVLVVDNAPSDHRTRDLVSAMGNVRYVTEPKPGLDFARNRAVQEASGEIIAFIDDDVVVDGCWLDGLREAWLENPDAGAFTGQVLPLELLTEAQILAEQLGGFRKGFRKVRYGPVLSSDPLYPCTTIFGNGCNMAFRRDVLLKLGGFDEALDTGAPLPGGGDLDMLYRVVRGGYPLAYEPLYLAYHEHRRDYQRLRSQMCRSWGTGCMAFLVKIYQSDTLHRDKAERFIRWWLKDLLKQLRCSLRGKGDRTPDLVIAELWGALVGLMGGYNRSRKRIERIREQYS